ncbi:MAG: hypothetical protein ACTHLE_09785 [Agriterribacter sp.]
MGDDAAWNNLSAGNVIKTDLNADAYQYPVIGNHGLVLLPDPYGFCQQKPAKAPYSPDIYYSGWWKSNRYERANPFTIKGGYNISGNLTPGKIHSFHQTLDVSRGHLVTKLALTVNGTSHHSTRTQFVTDEGVLVIKLEDDAANTFQVQIAPQSGYVQKHLAVSKGITASTSLGEGHGAVLSVIGEGLNVITDTATGIVAADVSPGKPAYFYIAAASEIMDGVDYINAAFQKAAGASKKGYNSLKDASEALYKTFWAKSSINVPDNEMMRKYILSQYILKATQDNNPLPDGCFGPRKEGYGGAIGTECDMMFCWNALLTANQPDIAKVLPNWFENTVENAKDLAKTFYPNTNGAKWAWLAGYDGTECQNFQGKKVDWVAFNSAFAAHISLLQAQYTRDAGRLARAKDILKLAVEYQLDACVKENGLWVNNGMIQGLGLKPMRGEITEQGSLLWSLRKAAELGIGPASWGEEAKKVYIPIRYDSIQDKNIIVRYNEHTPSLGNLPKGYFLYLYGTPWVSLFTRVFDAEDPLLQPTYQAYIGDKDLTYTFGKGIAAANAAMMNYGQEALSMLKAMPVHNDLYYSEYENRPETTPEVGAHGSLMLGIQNMLLDGQSDKTIKIFPALPAEWENSGAGFSKLLANGGIEVSGKYSNKMVSVTLNNTSNKEVVRTLLVRVPATFTKIAEASGIKISDMVNDRFAKMTVKIPAHSIKTFTVTGIHGKKWHSADDAGAQYSAGWEKSLNNQNFYGSSNHISNTEGAFCEYTFDGSGVKVIGEIGPDRGYAKVTIDGVNYGCYSLYASSAQPQKVLFEKYNLSPGKHLIKIEVTGRKIYVSKDTKVGIDKFEVLAAR